MPFNLLKKKNGSGSPKSVLICGTTKDLKDEGNYRIIHFTLLWSCADTTDLRDE